MKKIILFLVCLSFLLIPSIKAQYCNTTQGTVLYYKTFDSEKDQSVIDTSRVAEVLDKDNSLIVKYHDSNVAPAEDDMFAMTYVFDKQHTTYAVFMDAKEQNENIRKLMTSHYPESKKATAEEDIKKAMKMIRSEGIIRIPLSPDAKKGDEIPPCNFFYKIGWFKFTVTLNGKYEGFETVNTPVGKFNCLKVSYTVKSKVMMTSESYNVTEWYAEGIGMVKSMSTTKKGKSRSASILTSIEKE